MKQLTDYQYNSIKEKYLFAAFHICGRQIRPHGKGILKWATAAAATENEKRKFFKLEFNLQKYKMMDWIISLAKKMK